MSPALLIVVAGLALLDSLNPATILGVGLILVLPSRHPVRAALAYVLGAYLTVLALGAGLYLAAMIVEVVLLAVGVLSLLMIVPLAEQAADAGPAGAGWAQVCCMRRRPDPCTRSVGRATGQLGPPSGGACAA